MKFYAGLLIMLLAACNAKQPDVFKTGTYRLLEAQHNIPAIITLRQDGNLEAEIVNKISGNYLVADNNNISIDAEPLTALTASDEALEAEQNFLSILPRVVRYKFSGENLVLITSNGGELVFAPY